MKPSLMTALLTALDQKRRKRTKPDPKAEVERMEWKMINRAARPQEQRVSR